MPLYNCPLSINWRRLMIRNCPSHKIAIGPDGQILDVSMHAFVPGVDKNGQLITEEQSPGIAEQFENKMRETLSKAATSPDLRFPPGLSASSVVFAITYSNDWDATLPFEDLWQIALAGSDEKTQMLIRIATILYCASYDELSDHARARLPKSVNYTLGGRAANVWIDGKFGPALSGPKIRERALSAHTLMTEVGSSKRLQPGGLFLRWS